MKVKMNYPIYIKEFKCIGGTCEDSCCIGWDIDIDKATFKEYFKVKDAEMKRMFQKNIYNNKDCESNDIDYGRVKLCEGRRCAFLDDKNFCIIHSKLGEEYLSNVCTAFPRILNKIDDYYEISLDVACIEAARIFLSKEEGLEFTKGEETIGKHIVSMDINTRSKEFNNSPVKYLKEIRDFTIEILKNRKLQLKERLLVLGEFIYELEEVSENKDILKFIKSYDINKINSFFDDNSFRFLLQMNFFKKMIEFLNVNKEVDSEDFKNYTKEIMEVFKFNEEDTISKDSKEYLQAFDTYNERYFNKYSYIFENYLVNFVYNNLFPFNEGQSLFDAYIMLLTRYSFIRYYLVGLFIKKGEDNREDIIGFIEKFSKTIEHHRTYLYKSLRYIKEQEFDNLEFAKTLL